MGLYFILGTSTVSGTQWPLNLRMSNKNQHVLRVHYVPDTDFKYFTPIISFSPYNIHFLILSSQPRYFFLLLPFHRCTNRVTEWLNTLTSYMNSAMGDARI